MLKKGHLLLNEEDFEIARSEVLLIEVWQGEELIQCNYPIERLIPDAVYIQDGYFLREVCQFKIQ